MDKVVTHGNLSGAANGACTLIREALDIWGKYERQEPSYRAYHAGILKKLVRHHPGIFPDPLDSRGAPPSWDLGLVLGFGCPPLDKIAGNRRYGPMSVSRIPQLGHCPRSS